MTKDMREVDVTFLIGNFINDLRIRQIVINRWMDNYTTEDPQWNILYQISKDITNYIADQEHTLGLIEDGLI